MDTELKKILPRNIVFADVGARWDIPKPWFDHKQLLDIVCFEPDPEEFERLTRDKTSQTKVLNTALWSDAAELTLYLTKARGSSSLFRPNYDFLRQFPEHERFDVDATVKVTARSLDQLNIEKQIEVMDFIKIDVQGGELAVLMGGKDFINSQAVGAEVEVEFVEMYKDQPLFSDVDSFMRKELHLELQDIRKTYWKRAQGLSLGSPKGQLVFGDALYFRPVMTMHLWLANFTHAEAQAKLISAISMAMFYGYFDYGISLLADERCSRILTKEMNDVLFFTLNKYGRSCRPRGRGIPKVAGLLHAAYRLCEVSTGGWATYDLFVGSRKRWGWFQ